MKPKESLSARPLWGSRHCYAFGPPRRFQGIYVAEFEGKRFLQNVGPSKRYVPRDEVWLSLDEETDVSRTPRMSIDPERSRIWLIDFIGRKTVRAGSSGHMGGSSSELVVDRMLDAKLLSEFDGYVPPDVLTR